MNNPKRGKHEAEKMNETGKTGSPLKKIKIGVLYCGGCNSYFDRAQLFQEVASEFSETCDFSPYQESDSPDLILLINGCQSECLIEADYGVGLVVLNNLNRKDYSEIISRAISEIERRPAPFGQL
jgi:4-hydroxybutyrate CoA-transferase